ncbi:MAG: hypothetical protein Q6373_026080 [Candidatus Sigynarchaeota archaeon]
MLLQVQTTESWSVLVGRVAIFIVYFMLALFFRKNYAKSKKDGLPNKFALGYALFFGFLSFYGAMGIVDQGLHVFTAGGGFISKIGKEFDVLYGITPAYGLILPNLANPLYLIGLAILMLLLAAQVYPLELALNWKRIPATIYLFAIAAATIPIYIPAVSYSLYTDIVTIGTVGGMLLGLVLNIGINIKLASTSAGDLRKRSLSIIFASILFYIGFLLTLNIVELAIIHQIAGTPVEYDVVLGYAIQAIAALLYWRGLRTSS